jgi:hypothetical protein
VSCSFIPNHEALSTYTPPATLPERALSLFDNELLPTRSRGLAGIVALPLLLFAYSLLDLRQRRSPISPVKIYLGIRTVSKLSGVNPSFFLPPRILCRRKLDVFFSLWWILSVSCRNELLSLTLVDCYAAQRNGSHAERHELRRRSHISWAMSSAVSGCISVSH